MKLFKCQSCGQLLYFENRTCEQCGHRLGYLPQAGDLSALEETQDGLWQPVGSDEPPRRFCQNAGADACNWLVEADSAESFCVACRHNRTIPAQNTQQELDLWRKMEIAKHRLFYTLLKLHLPLVNRIDDPAHGLVFDFLEEAPGAKVLTGHDDGLVTLNLNEADDALREKLRTEMGEPYRTLLGHFRHEVGHYYWDVLVRDGDHLEPFRALFGDDRADYEQALKTHYANGAPPDWRDRFVSAYASAHPWEDWAETWAHYLHIVDTLEMASAFGMSVHPELDRSGELSATMDFDPHAAPDMQTLIDAWLPVSFAVNSLNRAMGHPDLYPFLLSPPVVEKLDFIHRLVRGQPMQAAGTDQAASAEVAESLPAG